MQIKPKRKKFMIGTCPVCGTSWKGRRFFYIYKKYLKETKGKNVTSRDLLAYVRMKHLLPNQSRLIQDDKTGDYICPDCSTHFQIKQDE